MQWDSNCAAQNAPAHVVKTDDTNSTMMKFEGNSELSELKSRAGVSNMSFTFIEYVQN